LLLLLSLRCSVFCESSAYPSLVWLKRDASDASDAGSAGDASSAGDAGDAGDAGGAGGAGGASSASDASKAKERVLCRAECPEDVNRARTQPLDDICLYSVRYQSNCSRLAVLQLY
jgi:hypothetical protein